MEPRNRRKKRKTSVHNVMQSSSEILKTSDLPNSETAISDVFGDERIGYILSNIPPIVECILENLPVQVLNKCACVCKLWNSVVQEIKRRRNNIFWMFKGHPAKKHHDRHVDVNNPQHAIFAAKRPRDLGKHFHQTLKDAFSEPKLAIMFIMDEIIAEKPRKYFRKYLDVRNANDQDPSKPAFVEYLSSHLPQQCSLISCFTSGGLIGTPIDFSCPVELERTVGFTGIFFPSIPGLETYTFSISVSDDTGDVILDDDAVSHLTGIPKDREVKCFLVFVYTLRAPEDLVSCVLEYYMKKQNFRIALGGAVMDDLFLPLKSNTSNVCIAFVGETVRAASVVLETSSKHHQIREKLNELKACNFPGQNNVAFVSASCGKWYSYGRPRMLAEIFSQVFPTVPLFGSFGFGEIGHTFFPNGSANVENRPSDPDGTYPNWCQENATVFLLLSWGKK